MNALAALAATAALAGLYAAIRRVAPLFHHPDTSARCDYCGTNWPCPTARTLRLATRSDT